MTDKSIDDISRTEKTGRPRKGDGPAFPHKEGTMRDESMRDKSIDDISRTEKTGRPCKGDGPAFPHEEVDRLLVHGELVESEDGNEMQVRYPTFRALADRYDVAHSLIAEYAKKHNCFQRRKQTAARVKELTDSKLAEFRSDALAVTKDDQIRAIDRFLVQFEEALEDGRVRFDNPTDYNTMCRLKAYLLGDADSRQQVTGSPFPFTLEDLQRRHAAMPARLKDSTPEERGEVCGPRSRGNNRPAPMQETDESRDDDSDENLDEHDESEKHDDSETVH